MLAAGVFGIAGFLFAASANTAAGTDLRSDTEALKDVVAQRAALVDRRQNLVRDLQSRVAVLTKEQEGTAAARAQGIIDRLSAPVGLLPMTGPAVTVSLTDAPQEGNEEANPDDLVVHQQDLQAVINAMWRGGALGVQVMDQRLINTSAVRCVGNTLILQGRVYSPPYVISAIGKIDALTEALDKDPQVTIYKEWVDAVGLGYRVTTEAKATFPAYSGPVSQSVAKVAK